MHQPPRNPVPPVTNTGPSNPVISATVSHGLGGRRTVNQGGVTWQELGAPGHDLEPAILTVPSGEGSGGSYSRAGETFVVLEKGVLAFTVRSPEPRTIRPEPGDALTIPPRATFEWHNPGHGTSRALWVESLISRPVVTAAGPTR